MEASSPALLLLWPHSQLYHLSLVLGCVEQGIFTSPIPPQDRWEMGTAVLCSQLWGWFTHTTNNKIGSIVLPCRGTRPAFPRIAAVRDSYFLFLWTQLFPILMNTSPALPTTSGVDMGKGISPHPMQLYGGWEVGLHLTTLGLSHPYFWFGSILVARRGTGPIFQNVVACGGQGQLSYSCYLRDNSPICLRHWWVGNGGPSLPSPCCPYSRYRVELNLPCSWSQQWVTCALINRVISALLPIRIAGLTFMHFAAG